MPPRRSAPRDDRRRAEPAEEAADEAGDRLLPVLDQQAEPEPDDRRERGADPAAREEARREDADRDPEAGREADRVPVAHRGQCTDGGLDEDRERVRLGLERAPRSRRRGPRRRPGAAAAGRSAPRRVEPAAREHGASRGERAAQEAEAEPRQRAGVTRTGATKSSPPAAVREPSGTRPGVGVRPAAAREHERGAAVAGDLELRLEVQPPAREQRRAPSSTKTTSPGRRPSSSRPRASTPRTTSASSPMPAEKQKRRPLTRPRPTGVARPLASASRDRLRRRDRVARQPERAREDARPAAGHEAERQLAGGAVDRLVVGAVAGEDHDRVGRAGGLRGELLRVAALARSAASRPRRSRAARPRPRSSRSRVTPDANGFTISTTRGTGGS